MGAFSVDGPEMPTVKSVEEMVGRFTSELIPHIPLWKEKLSGAPDRLEPLVYWFSRNVSLRVA